MTEPKLLAPLSWARVSDDDVLRQLEHALTLYKSDPTPELRYNLSFWVRMAHTTLVIDSLERNIDHALMATESPVNLTPFR